MQPLSSTVREHNLQAFANDRFDVLVIGGGVTGAGVALDAVARGYRVALVEKSDFASGTSSSRQRRIRLSRASAPSVVSRRHLPSARRRSTEKSPTTNIGVVLAAAYGSGPKTR